MDGTENFSAPVPPERMEQAYLKNLSWLALDKKKLHRQAKWRGALAMALIGCVCLQAAAITVMTMREQTRVLLATIRKDGTWAVSENIPPDEKVAVIQAELWEYVYRHEHYNVPDAHLDWDVVSAMSGLNVAKEYQDAMDSKNPKSRSRTLSDKKSILVRRLSGFFYSNTPDYSAGTYVMLFEQRMHEFEQTDTCQSMSVTIGYKTVAALPPEQIVSFNPARIIVTSYPRPVPQADPMECKS